MNGAPDMHEASFQHPADDGGAVVCDLCPHSCRIAEGKHGICRSRVNRGGVLYALSYARPCAVAVDPVEKKPLLHFHPGSKCFSIACTGCNFSCLNCQNSDISQASPEECESILLPPEEVVAAGISSGCPSIAYTYTEPFTWFEYMYDTARLAREKGLYNILVSAGYVQDRPLRQMCEVLDAANIDLKSFSDDTYRRISHGTLAPVLHTLEVMRDAGIELEITNLVIPGVNDSPEMITAMCKWLADNGFSECPLHFSRFFPRYKMAGVPPTPVKTLTLAAGIAREAGIKSVHLGNI